MVNQSLIDEVADLLVEQGIRVTHMSVNEALRERDRRLGGPGRGKSLRDLQAPLADWKRRRRYRAYLAHLDLPEEMDKAIATFVEHAMAVARRHAGPDAPSHEPAEVAQPEAILTRQFADFAESMQGQMNALAEQFSSLRDQVPSTAAGEAKAADLKREDRRRGLAAAAGRFFWDRMMQSFMEAIRERGPMTAIELLDTLDEDALAMARAAFEDVTTSVIKEKVEFRISKGNYFRHAPGGRYDVLPKHGPRAKRGGGTSDE
ncbi:hypothetical protein [Methylobacterium goesingense]|uniref:HTH OST-type domain-containing protein n=1 Tax=Methylobacterium goesingense TaxID=243690 RepID=A0ABV2LCJ2_9HYPH|nr:hypothetical protein [Methylobacterium goesingense]GJD76426.1 hypothetical protein CFIICLFH_4684 [Methylobacterium goesingense]